MSALLGNPMAATAALPFALGVALGFLTVFTVLRSPATVTLCWAAAILFLYWETLGAPTFPPTAASQKLVYLSILGVVLGLLANSVGSARYLGLIVAAAIVASFLWMGWRRLSGGTIDLAVVVAATCMLLAASGAYSLISAKADDAAANVMPHMPFLAPAAILSLAFAGAIISVLGASIVVAQFLGSVAALVGGYCLAGYVARLARPGSAFGWSRGVEILLVVASVTALLHTALFAPTANPVALLLAALTLFGPRLVSGPLRPLVPDSAFAGPVVAGLLVAVPAFLAIVIAVMWAPHGAALGLS